METAERITQQGDRVTLSLTSWGRLGEAMADYDGHRVFVAGGIPGERVVAEVVKLHRKYVSAKADRLVAGHIRAWGGHPTATGLGRNPAKNASCLVAVN